MIHRMEETLSALADIPLTPDGKLHMKNNDSGQFGYFSSLELLQGRYVLVLKDSADGQASLTFDSPDAVVAAGWSID